MQVEERMGFVLVVNLKGDLYAVAKTLIVNPAYRIKKINHLHFGNQMKIYLILVLVHGMMMHYGQSFLVSLFDQQLSLGCMMQSNQLLH